MEQILAEEKRPDGVLCATDMIAAGVLSCLSERKIAVPEKMKVAGMGHGAIADLCVRDLRRCTIIIIPAEGSGDLLLDLMRKKNRGRKQGCWNMR